MRLLSCRLNIGAADNPEQVRAFRSGEDIPRPAQPVDTTEHDRGEGHPAQYPPDVYVVALASPTSVFFAGILDIARSVIAQIVNDGLTPGLAGTTEPSQIIRFS